LTGPAGRVRVKNRPSAPRVVVIIVLLLAAVAVSVVVYLIPRNAEIDEYETQYKALADTVLRVFEDIVTQSKDGSH
jgi:Tfp pilus assembly protein PilO